MTDAELHRLIVSALRCRQYVITNMDDAGLAGVDPTDKSIQLTWKEAADALLTLMTKSSYIASDSERGAMLTKEY